jgi:hypothetical protein
MKQFINLPCVLVNLVLEYAGELRILKNKMNRKNIVMILRRDIKQYNPIGEFIITMHDRERRSSSIHFMIYSSFIHNLIMGNMNVLTYHFGFLTYTITQEMYDNLITVFINDYNHYYLNDEYYYCTWYNGTCYTHHCDEDISYDEDIYFSNIYLKDKISEIENFKQDVFYSFNQLLRI